MRVSVVMAGRNSNPTLLKEAIDSILNQTFQDFEFIFVDDGSEKPLESVVRSISTDKRISVYRIQPSGLGAALNYGISLSHGDLIARIDDDDISLSTRLEKQVKYMDSHPDVSCLGTQMYYKYGDKVYPHSRFPLDHKTIIKEFSKFHFVMGHTSLVYRRDCFDKIGGYRIPGGGQDYDLFFQMGTVGNLANLDDYLVCYSLSPVGLSIMNPKKRDAYVFALQSALSYEGYSTYYEDMRMSLDKLKNDDMKSMTPRLSSFLKRVLIWKVRIKGSNFRKLK